MPQYRLTINGHQPDNRLRASLVSYEAAFDKAASVKFRLDYDWTMRPYGLSAGVEFFVDNVRRFKGLLNPARPFIAANNVRYLEYEAVDLSDWAARLFPKNQFGNYSFTFNSGSLREIVDQYLAVSEVAAMLQKCGIANQVVYDGGADGVECFPVSLNTASVDGGFRGIAKAAPGVGVLLDCTVDPPRYRFVYLYGAAPYNLPIDAVRLEKLDITESYEGRAGAVVTLAGSTTGQTEFELDQEFTMAPAWDRTRRPPNNKRYEDYWRFQDANAKPAKNATPEQIALMIEKAKVFRYYSFAAATFPPPTTSPISVEQRVEHFPEDPLKDVWKTVEVLWVDHESKTLLLKHPALKNVNEKPGLARFNLFEAGRSRDKDPPVRIAYSSSQTGNANINIPSIRRPEVGFAGRFYNADPKRGATEILITVPGGVDRVRWAAFAHAMLSEPAFSGEIPIVGELPAELWPMGRRINLVSLSHGATGYEWLLAPIMGLTVGFEPNNPRATLQLSLDTEELLQEAST